MKKNEAMKQAISDIRRDLAREGKSYIEASLKQLKLKSLSEYTIEDMYCSTDIIYIYRNTPIY